MNEYRAEIEAAIPEITLEGLEQWIEHARPVGHFLTAVLSNDLGGAFNRADTDNTAAMPAIVKWLYNYAPSGCFGSRNRMDQWADQIRAGVA